MGIEKNEGCMHMTCQRRIGGCGFEFCWLCKGDWKDHGANTIVPGNTRTFHYSCNIYQTMVNNGEIDDEKEVARKAQLKREKLKKFTFCHERNQKHLGAIRFAKDTKVKTEARLKKMISGYSEKAGQIEYHKLCELETDLMSALDTVLECRRLLAWTYPIRYYMPEEFVQKTLFEDL